MDWQQFEIGKMSVYRIPSGVQALSVGGRWVLTTAQQGRVAVDPAVLSVWRGADGHSLAELTAAWKETAQPKIGLSDSVTVLRAALACLAEAGLLEREPARVENTDPLVNLNQAGTADLAPCVSVILVGYNSRTWLETCLPSLSRQGYTPLEIILVDNGSTDDTLDWLAQRYPEVRTCVLPDSISLAGAINCGVDCARGDYFLILNPDVVVEKTAIAEMLAVYQSDPACAAVAAKLRFSWAPAFFNGLGNRVGAFSWGMDNALGHLDLGQYDGWRELPSVCFAATLISRSAWQSVGRLDEKFPMYYEDSEWSYRARILGWKLLAAPQAVVYHAFSGRIPGGESSQMQTRKLRRVVYGRLRFAYKLLGSAFWLRFWIGYGAEDMANLLLSLLRRNPSAFKAILSGWMDFCAAAGSLRLERSALQARRQIGDRQLFDLQRTLPGAYIWHGLPELTWDLIRNEYLPLLASGMTHPVPEFLCLEDDLPPSTLPPAATGLERLQGIWRVQGLRMALFRIWRYTQQRLSQP